MTENITWRPVPGYSGYEASPDQQVKRNARRGIGKNMKESILSPAFYPKRPSSRSKSNGPYMRLTRDGKTNYVPLANIMASIFCGGFDPSTQKILFKDHNPKNCAPSNLTIIERH